MVGFRRVALSVVLVALALPAVASPPPPWYRPPLSTQQFSFTALITPTQLIDGVQVDAGNVVPSGWEGALIQGRFVMDLDQAEGGVGGPGQTAWSDGNPDHERFGNWLDIQVRQPDGNLLVIPAPGVARPPLGANNNGSLVVDSGENVNGPDYNASLHLERTFADTGSTLDQRFRLDLEGERGPGGLMIRFDDNAGRYLLPGLQIDASRADVTNAGFLSQTGADGNSYRYGFTLLSVTHMAPVPEPATLALLASGVAVIAARRRRAPAVSAA